MHHHSILLLCLLPVVITAGEVPYGHADFRPTPERPVGWRGDGSGRFPGATPVADWDLKTGRNVAWKVKLPFFSAASPIVVGDKVFTTAEPDLLICLEAKTGKELWRRHNAVYMEQIEAVERERLYGLCTELLEIADGWMRAPGVHNGQRNGDIADPANMLWSQTSDSRKTALEPSVRALAVQRGLDLDRIRAIYAEVGSGKKEWPTRLPQGKGLLSGRYYSWSGNMPATPASDGTVVVVRIASQNHWGYLLCYDLAGNRRWQVETGLTGSWGCAYDSPLIIAGLAVSRVRGQGKTKDAVTLTAFDLATGAPRWSVPARGSCASPVRLDLGGVPLIVHDGAVYAPADGARLGGMDKELASKLSTFGSPSVDGDQVLDVIGGRLAKPLIHRLRWVEPGRTVAYEQVFMAVNSDHGGIPYQWDRGSPLLAAPWIFKSNSKSEPVPALFFFDTSLPYEQKPNRTYGLSASQPVRPRLNKDKEAPYFGPPSEDDMSAVMGGRLIFAAPSHWPSQFVVVSAPPDLKLAGQPVLEAAAIGSPVFQGDRTYIRDYRNLYCFGPSLGP